MEVKHEAKDIPITASEIAYLWNSYLLNNKSKHVLIYAVAQCDDKDIRAVLQQAVDSATRDMNSIKAILDGVKQRIPYAFSEEDVYANAPKIYSDKLMLYILKIYTMVGLSNYGAAVSASPRQDIRKFFTDSMISTLDLSNKIDDMLLNKGIYLRTPYIPPRPQVEFAEDKSIMGRIIGHKRPLNVFEINALFSCSMTSSIVEAELLGMAQTIEDVRLKEFARRAGKTLKEQAETINEILHNEDLAFPPSLVSDVLNSSKPAFSDRLSMYFCFATLEDTLSIFSMGKVESMRKDIFMTLSQLSGEIVLLLKDATDLLVERNWFEEMPKNIDRELITH